ncbi:MAG: hypothetical protein QOE49_5164, partial [Rhodospirillaceae bacterium]|nr:hypothetical protein [Rhodospirillaceae bacterium]
RIAERLRTKISDTMLVLSLRCRRFGLPDKARTSAHLTSGDYPLLLRADGTRQHSLCDFQHIPAIAGPS